MTLDKKTISLVIVIISGFAGIQGHTMYSNGETNTENQLILKTMKAEINEHKAESNPHIGTSIKLENIKDNIVDIKIFVEKTDSKIDTIMIMLCSNEDFNC